MSKTKKRTNKKAAAAAAKAPAGAGKHGKPPVNKAAKDAAADITEAMKSGRWEAALQGLASLRLAGVTPTSMLCNKARTRPLLSIIFFK